MRYAAILIHASVALITIGLFLIHVYMSTILEEGSFGSMIHGYVTRAWAWTFHRTWYYEVTGRSAIPSNDAMRSGIAASAAPTNWLPLIHSPRKGCVFTPASRHFRKAFTRKSRKLWRDSPKISSDRPLRDELDLFLLLPQFPRFLVG